MPRARRLWSAAGGLPPRAGRVDAARGPVGGACARVAGHGPLLMMRYFPSWKLVEYSRVEVASRWDAVRRTGTEGAADLHESLAGQYAGEVLALLLAQVQQLAQCVRVGAVLAQEHEEIAVGQHLARVLQVEDLLDVLGDACDAEPVFAGTLVDVLELGG